MYLCILFTAVYFIYMYCDECEWDIYKIKNIYMYIIYLYIYMRKYSLNA